MTALPTIPANASQLAVGVGKAGTIFLAYRDGIASTTMSLTLGGKKWAAVGARRAIPGYRNLQLAVAPDSLAPYVAFAGKEVDLHPADVKVFKFKP